MGTTNPVFDFLRALMDHGVPVTCVYAALSFERGWLARKVGPEGFKNTAKKDPNKIQSKGTLGHPAAVAELGAARNPVKKRYQRENEPWPQEHGVRENEPTPDPGVRESEPTSVNSSLHGSQVARLAVSNSYGW